VRSKKSEKVKTLEKTAFFIEKEDALNEMRGYPLLISLRKERPVILGSKRKSFMKYAG